MKKNAICIALFAMMTLSLGVPITTVLAAEPAAPVASASPLPAGPTVAPQPSATPAIVAQPAASQELPAADFLTQVLQAIKDFGGLPTVLKIAAIITLLLSSMKVTILNELVWSKLGDFKPWAAPILGLIAGVLDLAKAGTVSWASVFAYISAGAGALILHDLLDSVKAIPKLGDLYVKLIELIQKALGPVATKKSE